MKSLTDKVIWVTGASSGIGEALIYALQHHNCKLILSARRTELLDQVIQNCEEQYRNNMSVLKLDLVDAESLESTVNAAIRRYNKVDILINNGGISQRDRAINTKMEVDRKIMEVNYFGSIALSKYLIPHMIANGEGHHVVVSSAVGIISTPLRSSYSASKHALHGFYDALRAEHHKDKIKVTIICPGYIKTNISYNALMGDGSLQNKMDEGQENGISSEECAERIVKAIRKNKEEVYIGGLKEVFGIYVKRYFPGLFSKLILKMKVT